MRANPGGHIPPSEVVGRDALITRLWRTLEQQSVILTAERRIGKTCIIQKMVAEPRPSSLPIYRDLEGIRTPLEFVETVYGDVEEHLRGLDRTAGRFRQWLSQLGGAELAGIKLPESLSPHWKSLLTRTIEDLVEHREEPVVLFWDEVPLMHYNLRQHGGEQLATEVLDTLRSLRQTHSDLRMVFTGSIGLHNVITSLKRSGYANAPINDMAIVDVPPLSPADGQELARSLIDGEQICAQDVPGLARAVAKAVDGVPFYIHHLVNQLAQRSGPANRAAVADLLDTCLTDPQDPWHLRYYRERIDTYYDAEEGRFALQILDVLATAPEPLPFNRVFDLLKSHLVTEDQEMARYVLVMLQRDHYLIRNRHGAHSFRFPLIQRWWKQDRGLGS